MATNQLGMFAKYWEPNTVKTRLAATIGAEEAAQLYRASLLTLLDRLGDFGARRTLYVTPFERQPEFESIAKGQWIVLPQTGDDLGQRMKIYFSEAFQEAANRVVLIGSDSPTLPREFIESAFEMLSDHDVVLGPSEDGGYYLVGASRQVPPIFDGVAWSSPHVWEQTVAMLETHSIPWQQLESWYDVDDVASLKKLCDEVEQGGGRDWPLLNDMLKEYVGCSLKKP